MCNIRVMSYHEKDEKPFWTSDNMVECFRLIQRGWRLEEEEARRSPKPLSVGDREAPAEEKRTSVQGSFAVPLLEYQEVKTTSREKLRQKSESYGVAPLRIFGRGHGRRFNAARAYRLFEPGILRSVYVQRLTEAFGFRDRAIARRWVKRMEDGGYFTRVGSPARLEATEKAHRLQGWRKGKEAIEGAVAAMPGNVRQALVAREADYLWRTGWELQKGWNFRDGIDRWYDGTWEAGTFYFTREHAVRIQRERDSKGQE